MKTRLTAALGVSMLVLAGCGGGDGEGGGSSGVTDKPTSADVQRVATEKGFSLPCEVTLKDGPAIPDIVEHKLLTCPDQVSGGEITVGSYYRYKDAPSLEKSRDGFGSGPRFENGNVAVIVADVTEGPAELPQALKEDCGCGTVTGG